ncbi:MAG: hypothetical protein CVU81_01910 [Euryarchaeota archaeon HGW-Euryarchaeota-1]|nr:MAG: hypothetical protein CVU81_01910 [Euryarchaeota archaeon HGW-Euryarchaeota-1]
MVEPKVEIVEHTKTRLNIKIIGYKDITLWSALVGKLRDLNAKAVYCEENPLLNNLNVFVEVPDGDVVETIKMCAKTLYLDVDNIEKQVKKEVK